MMLNRRVDVLKGYVKLALITINIGNIVECSRFSTSVAHSTNQRQSLVEVVQCMLIFA